MAQQEDIAWFEQNRTFIAEQYPGQWVVVKNLAVVGAYPDYASAYDAGTQMFGTEPFLVKEATSTERVEMIGRRPSRLGQFGDLAEQLRRDGALVNVTISVPASLAQQFQAQGQAVPPPQSARAMIDTGASISTVTDEIAQAAGLRSVGSIQVGGVGGTSQRTLYSASFGLPEYGLVVGPIEMAGVSLPAGFQVLIGRDILKALNLSYEGPQGAFSLTQEDGVQAGRGSTPVYQPAAQPLQAGKTDILPIVAGVGALALAALFAFDVL